MRVVVTGANSGIGLATARSLAAGGHHVTMGCRSVERRTAAAQGIAGEVEVRALDLGSLDGVRAFAEETGEIDVLFNNAGVLGLPLSHTADGFETHIARRGS